MSLTQSDIDRILHLSNDPQRLLFHFSVRPQQIPASIKDANKYLISAPTLMLANIATILAGIYVPLPQHPLLTNARWRIGTRILLTVCATSLFSKLFLPSTQQINTFVSSLRPKIQKLKQNRNAQEFLQ